MATDENVTIVHLTGINVSLGETVFKKAQPKLAAKMLERGAKQHIASQYVSHIKRTKFQPYKFLVKNIWCLDNIEKGFQEGIPVKPQSFGVIKGQPLGAFHLECQEVTGDSCLLISDIPESEKSNPQKIVCIIRKLNDTVLSENIKEKVDKLLNILKTELKDKISCQLTFKKHVIKGNTTNSDAFPDWILEVFINESCPTDLCHRLDEEASKDEKVIEVSYGVFTDFAYNPAEAK